MYNKVHEQGTVLAQKLLTHQLIVRAVFQTFIILEIDSCFPVTNTLKHTNGLFGHY